MKLNEHWLIARLAVKEGFGTDIWGLTPTQITNCLRVSHSINLLFD
jgi:hypothetical protein